MTEGVPDAVALAEALRVLAREADARLQRVETEMSPLIERTASLERLAPLQALDHVRQIMGDLDRILALVAARAAVDGTAPPVEAILAAVHLQQSRQAVRAIEGGAPPSPREEEVAAGHLLLF